MQEPIEISTTRRVDAQTSFVGGDSLDNNPYSRMIEKLFGVKYTVSWTWATEDEMNSKYNLAMASGDLPDYLETVPMTVFIKMVEADLLEDLTDAYPMYASQRWQDTWAEFGELPWTWSRVNGRIYGLPRVEDLAHNDTVLWYRADWFDELGLEVPTTLDELHAAAMAIVEAGIGMGAEGTTIGLMANKEYDHTWYGSLDPIWGAYGLIPDRWSQEGDGLMYDAIRPELKEPLQLLSQWYQDGIFRSDFFTIETSESVQDVASGQCGLHFTPSWGANLDTVNNDPNTRWAFTDIPAGPDGHKGKYTENNFREGPFCFRKGMEHVDKVFMITNWMIDLTEDFDRRMHSTYAWEGYNYNWEGETIVPTNIGWMPWAPGPIGTRGSGMIDPRRVGNEITYWREEWGKIPPEERDALQTYLLEDPTGVQAVSQDSRVFILETADLGMMTELQRTPTPTMVERWVDLQKLVEEAHLSIITGGKPIEAFDDMVTQWKQQGGEQVLAEVNEWWASRA
jgi:putative aldouronate transport system substrate-binding protein